MEEEQYELRIPPGVPNLEDLLSEALKKFNLKLISPKDINERYYMALRGNLKDVQAAKEHFRKRLEEYVSKLEKNTK